MFSSLLLSAVADSGDSLQLRAFLNLLPASESDNEKFLTDQPLEVYPLHRRRPRVAVADAYCSTR